MKEAAVMVFVLTLFSLFAGFVTWGNNTMTSVICFIFAIGFFSFFGFCCYCIGYDSRRNKILDVSELEDDFLWL